MNFGGDDEDEDLDLAESTNEEDDEENGHEESASEGHSEGDERVDGKEKDAQEGDAREVRGGRASARIRALAEEAKQSREDNARMRRELDEFKAAQTQRQQAPDPEVERRKLEMMSPDERMEYRLEQSERQNRQMLQQMQFQNWENGDRAAFAATVATNPVAAKHKDDVEKLYQEQLKKGAPTDRETILAYVVGKAALARAPKEVAKARDKGRQNIERQRVSPTNARGNVSAERRGGKGLEDKLADVFI